MAKSLIACLFLLAAATPTRPALGAERPAPPASSFAAARARAPRSHDAATTTASSQELLRSGDFYMQLGNYAKAEECFKTAYAKERQNPSLDPPQWRRLVVLTALAHQNNNEPERAAALYREALGKDPKAPLFHYFLAVALAFQEQLQAEADRAAALEDAPKPEPETQAKEPSRPRPASDEIFDELRRAYLFKENLGPGEKIPNPRTDIFLSPLRHDPRFQAVLADAGPAAEPDILADVDELIKAGEDAGPELQQALAEELEAHREAASEMLLRKLAGAELDEKQRAGYLWAVGRTGDPRAAEPLAHLLYRPDMVPLKGVALEALSRLGGPVAGNALLQELRDAGDATDRFQILTLLANMQFEPALPLMLDLLALDTEQAANQMAYCFGKMGDKAVPLLLNRIADPDKTTRINAINMLLWLCPSRAMIPLQKQYGQEKDPEVRLAILAVLGSLMRPEQFEVLLKAALARETDREALAVMREKLAQLPEKKAAFAKFQKEKTDNRPLFAAAYDVLYKSYGQAGVLEDLARLSVAADEPDLQRLRARILDRQSEECFADYMKLNRIIAFNRMIEPARPSSNVTVREVERPAAEPPTANELLRKMGEGSDAKPSLLPGLRPR